MDCKGKSVSAWSPLQAAGKPHLPLTLVPAGLFHFLTAAAYLFSPFIKCVITEVTAAQPAWAVAGPFWS